MKPTTPIQPKEKSVNVVKSRHGQMPQRKFTETCETVHLRDQVKQEYDDRILHMYQQQSFGNTMNYQAILNKPQIVSNQNHMQAQ